jgi:hypothetical protein
MDRFGPGYDCNYCGTHVPSGITSCPTCTNLANTKRMADAAEAQLESLRRSTQTGGVVTILHLSPEESARTARFGDNTMAVVMILVCIMCMFASAWAIPIGIIAIVYLIYMISLK